MENQTLEELKKYLEETKKNEELKEEIKCTIKCIFWLLKLER